MKKIYLLVVSALLFSCWNQAATAAETIRERVYIQTDKPLYLAGELMWLKLILTDQQGEPSLLSKVAYVELYDESSPQVQIKLEINEGVAEGWIMIPATLPTANYRLIGYTRYMLNEGSEVFFEQELPIVNTFAIDRTVSFDADSTLFTFTKTEGEVKIQSPLSLYDKRTKGQLTLSQLPDDLHTLSLSITAYDGLPIAKATDNLKRWEEQLPRVATPKVDMTIIPEYEGHILTGTLIDTETGLPHYESIITPLLAFTGKDIRLFAGKLDEDANVSFFTKKITGTHEIVTTALSFSEKEYRVDIHSPFYQHPEKKMAPIRLHPSWNDKLLNRSVSLQVLHSYMADSMSRVLPSEGIFQYSPARSYPLDEYTRFVTMEEVVIEFIPSLRFRSINRQKHLSVLTEERMGFAMGNSLVLIDGIPISNHENIFNYDPLLVERIDVYRGRYLFGGQYFNGMAVFNTYHDDYPGMVFGPSTQFFDYAGTQDHRLFYMPDYTAPEQQATRLPDYRNTLLWMPEVATDGQSSITIPFTTSDLPGDYIITVEGLTRSGKAIYSTELITVK
ncbi:hypothetical protein LJC35_06225 [Parabacteroides sp. OttesenSCG-928-N08]|nr:hypothetical protein [Parabacteroides sp. OttesenSCG-928-N08]